MFCYICVGIARTRDPSKLNHDVYGEEELTNLGVRRALTAVAGTPVCAEHMDHLQAPLSAYGAAQMQLAQLQPQFNKKPEEQRNAHVG